MPTLAGKTLFISGASRGIGLAIALRAARDGANIVIAAKTGTPHPKLPLLPHPFVEERMQQLCEGIRFQSDPPVFCSVAAPFFRKRSLASCSSSGVMFR